MFARCARVAPARMRTASSPWYLTDSVLSSCTTDTPSPSTTVKAPRAPFTVTAPGATLTVTPLGRSMIRLATRDMFSFPSCDDAQHFAALADRVRRLVGHDTLGRRDDHGTHAAEHARNLVLAAIDPQARAADPLDPVDDRAAFVILQIDGQHGLALIARAIEVRDVALVLQYREDRGLELRRRDRHARLARGLAVADAGQQIGDRIGHAHRLSSYQLALPSPGISPRIATSRILTRARPNLRYTPRERPVIAQRLRCRLTLASRGWVCSATCAATRCSGVDFGLRMISLSCARLTAYFFTTRERRFSRSIMLVLAIPFFLETRFGLLAEREAEGIQQCPPVLVVASRGGNRDIHAANVIDLVVLNLGEDDLLAHAHAVVTAPVEAARGDAAKVADAWYRHADQPIQELVHAGPTQRDLAADGQALAQLEGGDGLLGLADLRLLAGDLGHVAGSGIDDLAVRHGLAHAHVDRDLGDARHFHDVREAQLSLELRNHRLAIKLL